MEYEEVKLETINGGAAQELFAEEFKKVLANINDVCVDADAVREIKLTFKIKPSKDRASAVTTVEAHTKLAGITPHEGSIFLSFRQNKPQAYCNNIKQSNFEFEEKEKHGFDRQ